MSDGWYDTAEICLLGHTSNDATRFFPQQNKQFCDRCGSKTIQQCPTCQSSIQGEFQASGVIGFHSFAPPAYCLNCGEPFPWTIASSNAAHAHILESEILSLDERESLAQVIDDLVKDSPMTSVAVIRFKKLMIRVGQGSADAFKSILVELVSEATKRAIWG